MTGEDQRAFEDRFTLFLDFLGASNAARTWPKDRLYDFVDLLTRLSHAQSVEYIVGDAKEDGSYGFTITPEVTTFSDNVVVSWRGVPEEGPVSGIASHWTEIICKDAIRIIFGVADSALQIGLLVRGSFSYGQLYHQQGVVFGEAMVDAYRLETKIANDPRIVVCDRIISKLSHERPENMLDTLLRDRDGRWHLNYFTAMMRHAAPPSPDAWDQALAWKQRHLARIEQEIGILKVLDANDGRDRTGKWEWFKERFEVATERFRTYE